MMKKIKLLVIDDEDIVLNSTKRILKDYAYDIDMAHSGEEGLEKAEAKAYDIVVTDLMMPGIGGMEVLRNLRDTQPGVTVIVFTGYATVETVREALKIGAFDYIPKPFSPDEFRSVIDNAVKARESASDSKMLDLMAIVSHELKSPISVVHTTAETLYKGYFGNLDEKQQKSVEAILRNCQYLEDVIRNYLDLSKMDLENLESFKDKINLVDDVINPVLDIPEYRKNLKKMPLKTDLEVKPEIFGDANLLKIVVTNLVNNAIKYGKEGTEIKINLKKENTSYVFSIFNEGVGVDEKDVHDKLFKKFSRLKQKGTEGIKGSGLGLYMCKEIVEKHNGRIYVKSVTGESVTFYFTLPA